LLRFYWLVLGVLAVWRITHLLQAEDGPWNLVARIRLWLGHGFWGRLMDCFYCLSIWIALPIAVGVGESAGERLLLWPALSGGAALLERATQKIPLPARFFEDDPPIGGPAEQEVSDVVLRGPEEPGRRGGAESPRDAK
jgi:hypothetical protein